VLSLCCTVRIQSNTSLNTPNTYNGFKPGWANNDTPRDPKHFDHLQWQWTVPTQGFVCCCLEIYYVLDIDGYRKDKTLVCSLPAFRGLSLLPEAQPHLTCLPPQAWRPRRNVPVAIAHLRKIMRMSCLVNMSRRAPRITGRVSGRPRLHVHFSSVFETAHAMALDKRRGGKQKHNVIGVVVI
jgi:hypothetical protein